MTKFPTFKLTEKEIRGIANIVLHEQGTIAGWYAEASQIANLAERKYGGNPVRAVTSGWYAKGKSRFNAGTKNKTVIAIVKDVFLYGHRTLPRYVDEHDCLSDIGSVIQNGNNIKWAKRKWKKHQAFIRNHMGSSYWFYSFPGGYNTGVDPFGYTSLEARKKYGDFCYKPNYILAKWGVKMPTLKKGSEGKSVKVWQIILGVPITGKFGGTTEDATKEFQKKHKLTADGIVGSFTWSAGLGEL